MRDTSLVFNSNATINAGTYSLVLDIGKWAAKGVWVEILQLSTAALHGTAMQLTATMQFSDSATFASGVERGPELLTQQSTVGFRVSKLCQSKRRYARIQYSVFGTSPCFTGIYAHITSGPQRDDT